jgi:hypothetical protein
MDIEAVDVERIEAALGCSWEESTQVAYGSGLLMFHVYCDQRNISEERRGPATRDVDMTNPLDAEVYACLTTCFYATARLGEFTVERLSDQFNPERSITPKHLSRVQDRDGNWVTNLRIPRTKVSDDGQDVFWAKQNDETDPESALHRSSLM